MNKMQCYAFGCTDNATDRCYNDLQYCAKHMYVHRQYCEEGREKMDKEFAVEDWGFQQNNYDVRFFKMRDTIMLIIKYKDGNHSAFEIDKEKAKQLSSFLISGYDNMESI